MKYIAYIALLASTVCAFTSIMPPKYLDERRNNQDFVKMERMHQEEMKIRNKLFRSKVRGAHYNHIKKAKKNEEKFSNSFIMHE